jgi:hypothetical protein
MKDESRANYATIRAFWRLSGLAASAPLIAMGERWGMADIDWLPPAKLREHYVEPVAFKSRWCFLIHRQPELWPWTPKTSRWPRLTHGEAAGLVMRIHVLAGASRGQGATPPTIHEAQGQAATHVCCSTRRAGCGQRCFDLRQAPISKALTLLCL